MFKNNGLDLILFVLLSSEIALILWANSSCIYDNPLFEKVELVLFISNSVLRIVLFYISTEVSIRADLLELSRLLCSFSISHKSL